MSQVKYPNITVRLTGTDGNPMALISKVKKALENAGVPSEERVKFLSEALSGDYDRVLRTCMTWVNVV